MNISSGGGAHTAGEAHDDAANATRAEAIEGRESLVNWSANDYAVAKGDVRIGRIYRAQLPAGERWLWFIHTTYRPSSGAADTLAEAHAQLDAAYDQISESMKPRGVKPGLRCGPV